MVQEDDFSLNVGLDKNTDYNFSRVHYQLGLGAAWTLSTIEGSVMIRPVLQSGVEQVFTAIDAEVPWPMVRSSLWPNPAQDGFTVSVNGIDRNPSVCVMVDMMGRTVHEVAWTRGQRANDHRCGGSTSRTLPGDGRGRAGRDSRAARTAQLIPRDI